MASKYRSIDVPWEHSEVIYIGDDSSDYSIFSLELNGIKSVAIVYGTNNIPGYFESIGFDGELLVRGKVSLSVFKFNSGRLHCLTGPAIEQQRFGYSEYSWYKRGKPWYCLKNKDGSRYGHYHLGRGRWAWFEGELWDNTDIF